MKSFIQFISEDAPPDSDYDYGEVVTLPPTTPTAKPPTVPPVTRRALLTRTLPADYSIDQMNKDIQARRAQYPQISQMFSLPRYDAASLDDTLTVTPQGPVSSVDPRIGETVASTQSTNMPFPRPNGTSIIYPNMRTQAGRDVMTGLTTGRWRTPESIEKGAHEVLGHAGTVFDPQTLEPSKASGMPTPVWDNWKNSQVGALALQRAREQLGNSASQQQVETAAAKMAGPRELPSYARGHKALFFELTGKTLKPNATAEEQQEMIDTLRRWNNSRQDQDSVLNFYLDKVYYTPEGREGLLQANKNTEKNRGTPGMPSSNTRVT